MSLLEDIKDQLEELNANFAALPDWIPISSDLAAQYKWNSVDMMRRWCSEHVAPDKFEKRGKAWHLHRSVLRLVKNRIPMM